MFSAWEVSPASELAAATWVVVSTANHGQTVTDLCLHSVRTFSPLPGHHTRDKYDSSQAILRTSTEIH